MKKTLIAIAALAATGAFAQSSVQLDGLVDAGYYSLNNRGKTATGFSNNLAGISQFNLRGTQDLGGGLMAGFRMESDINPTQNAANTGSTVDAAGAAGTTKGTATTFLNGEQKLFIGSATMGTLAMGAVNNLGLDSHGTAQPFGTAIGSGFRATSTSQAVASVAGIQAAAVRYDNSVRYDSPKFAGGLGLTYQGRGAQTTATSSAYAAFGSQQQSAIRDLGATYNAGPINAVIATMTDDNTSNAGNLSKLLTAGVNYNMGATTLYGGLQQSKTSSAAGVETGKLSQYNFAAKYVTGVNTFMAQYAKVSNKLADGKSTTIGLGYNYALSKSADIVARYERITDEIGLTATAAPFNGTDGNTRTRLGAGLQVRF